MVKEIDIQGVKASRVKTSINLPRDIVDKCMLVAMGKNIIISKLTQELKKQNNSKLKLEVDMIGLTNRNEAIEDLITMALASSTTLYKINDIGFTPNQLIEAALDSMANLIINLAEVKDTDLIGINNKEDFKNLEETREAFDNYIKSKGKITNIIKNDVGEYIAFHASEIEEIVEDLKKTTKSKNELEAFENLGGYEWIEERLINRANNFIDSLEIDDVIDIIRRTLGYDI